MAGYTSKHTLGNGTIPANLGKIKTTAMQRPSSNEKIQWPPTGTLEGKANIHQSKHISHKDYRGNVSKAGARLWATWQRNNWRKNQGQKTMQENQAGKYGWTLELNKAIQMVLYWKGIEKRQNRGKIGKDILTWWGAQGGITHTQTHFELAPTTIKSNINQAYQYLRWIQANKERRQHWLSQLIAAQAEQEQRTKKVYGNGTRSLKDNAN